MIGFLSTFPPQRCGIGTYTSALTSALAGAGHAPLVFSERGALDGAGGGVRSVPCWDRRGDYGPAVRAAIGDRGVRLLHVQHAPDILGMDDRLPRLLAGVRQMGVATVVTLHTVHTPFSGALERRFDVLGFHRRLAAATDAIVVHGERLMSQELLRQGVAADKIHVIAHGTKVTHPPERGESRRHLGLPEEGPLLLYFGFIHVQKNLHTVLRAMRRLGDVRQDVGLLVAGSIQNPAWYNRAYWWLCRRLAARVPGGRVVLRQGFVAADDVPYLYGAADLVVLPYAQGYGSSSGVVHNALGAGRVMICSRGPKFIEIGENVADDLLVPTHDAAAWADKIDLLLREHSLRDRLAARVTAYAEETSWARVAARHVPLYEHLVRGKGAITPVFTSTLNRVTT